MRKRNKLASMLLAAVMVMGLAGTAFASEGGAGTYTDVDGHWGQEAIERVVALGLIDGKTSTTFAPDEIMTRADLVLALYRLAGSPTVTGGANPFHDVPESAKYRDAVVWANAQGIVSGINRITFNPSGGSERQAIAKVMNAFAAWRVKKDALTSSEDVLSAYPDAAQVQSWAVAPLNWAVASAFITGTSGGRLDPAGTATRAQVAAILCRYLDDDTGDASKDDSRNQDGIGENELLVVSFGTSFNDNRVATIKAVEDAMEKAFPEYSVRRGFTADTIIEHVFRRDGQEIDSVKEALDRAKSNGVKNLLVQPTHLMNGYEYGDLVKLLQKRTDDFETIRIGAPLLTTDEDFTKVAEAMVAATAGAASDGKTAVCYMGHGTAADSNSIYTRMQEVLKAAGHDNYFIGTVESAPTAEDLVKAVQAAGYEKVVLRPMMIVAGDHANNDMAGDEADSWKSVFQAAGLEVTADISGLGSLEAVQQLLVDHAKEAKPLSETGIAVQPNPENPDNEEPEETPAPQEPAEEPKAALADGVYTIEVECEQSMFKIESCELTVQDGKMTAALVLGSESFDKMFAGTKSAAAQAKEGLAEGVVADGKTTFTLSVEALDKALDYAAHSVKKDTWYDRTLTFQSATAAAK